MFSVWEKHSRIWQLHVYVCKGAETEMSTDALVITIIGGGGGGWFRWPLCLLKICGERDGK